MGALWKICKEWFDALKEELNTSVLYLINEMKFTIYRFLVLNTKKNTN